MALHRQLPGKPLVVSGFSGRLDPRGWNEAEITARLFAQQGIDPARVRFEAQSRNTAENARLTAALVGQGDGRPWLLVTSAWHMPRAVASFRAARSEEHTSELQSLMRISYAVFCLKKKKQH